MKWLPRYYQLKCLQKYHGLLWRFHGAVTLCQPQSKILVPPRRNQLLIDGSLFPSPPSKAETKHITTGSTIKIDKCQMHISHQGKPSQNQGLRSLSFSLCFLKFSQLSHTNCFWNHMFSYNISYILNKWDFCNVSIMSSRDVYTDTSDLYSQLSENFERSFTFRK